MVEGQVNMPPTDYRCSQNSCKRQLVVTSIGTSDQSLTAFDVLSLFLPSGTKDELEQLTNEIKRNANTVRAKLKSEFRINQLDC